MHVLKVLTGLEVVDHVPVVRTGTAPTWTRYRIPGRGTKNGSPDRQGPPCSLAAEALQSISDKPTRGGCHRGRRAEPHQRTASRLVLLWRADSAYDESRQEGATIDQRAGDHTAVQGFASGGQPVGGGAQERMRR